MDVYFVRHGQSEAHAQDRHQGIDDPLSARGKAQAEAVAERFTRIPLSCIFSSPGARAKETAGIIATRIGMSVEHRDFFSEKRLPSQLFGLPHGGEEAKRIIRDMREHYRKGSRYSDEETFRELYDRVAESRKFLEQRSDASILVVSHGHFLRMFTFSILLGEALNATLLDRIWEHTETSNTGITVFRFTQEKGWVLRVWDDHAHLG